MRQTGSSRGPDPCTSKEAVNATVCCSSTGRSAENGRRGSIPDTFNALSVLPGKARIIGCFREKASPPWAREPGSMPIDQHILKG
ncbi:hypothetical protein ACVWY0_002091 [Arthrobacter sp. UYNi723]